MVLYKATKDGNIPMDAKEEAETLKQWDDESKKIPPPAKKALEERVFDLETAISILSKAK